MMVTVTRNSFSPAITSSYATCIPQKPINSLVCPNFFRPKSLIKELPRFRITQSKIVSAKRPYRPLEVCGVVDRNSETYPEAEEEPSDSSGGATIDIKLPRRSLLVQFTCNDCGERTERLINRLAYERGLVFVQCAGCEQYHKLADNLGLIIEYDLREENSTESKADQV